jgi:predicted metal-dependent HD superfamily phosphohydrolase
MEHVKALLARIEALEARGLLQRPLLVKLAAFFHDAVYDPSASHNEMRFAEMWRRFGAPCATKLSPDLSVNLSDDL